MREWLYFAGIFTMMLCMAGCGTAQTKDPAAIVAQAEFHDFYAGDLGIDLGGSAAVLGELGEPLSRTESPSCAGQGVDKTYGFPGFYLTTLEQNGEETVTGAWFADDSMETREGIAIGDSEEAVRLAYPNAASDGESFAVLWGDTRLSILLRQGKVESIRYSWEQSGPNGPANGC